MSLSAHDRQELGAIENEFIASEPRLVAMLSTFSRLAAGEAMPGRERIEAGRPPTVVRAAFGLFPRRAARPGSRGTTCWRQLAGASALAVWLAVSVALIVAGILLSHHASGAGTCAPWADTACGTQAPAHSQAAHSQAAHSRAGH